VSAYVFIGPTLTESEAMEEFEAIYRPPVTQGDVIRVLARRPSAIGIVDGYFERVPAVWHKEILWALSRGVPVFGGASMGALRAAELAAFGMEGVGTIFERYRDGELEDDDEVAVAHTDAATGFTPVSEAMVVVRSTLARAESEAIVRPEQREALEGAAKALYYADRTWPAILDDAARRGVEAETLERVGSWIPGGRVDCKREDALELLRRMRAHAERGSPRVQIAFHFEHTEWWDHARRTAGELQAAPSGRLRDVDSERILDEARLTGSYAAVRRDAVLSALATEEARRARMAPSAEQLRAAEAELAARHGLEQPKELEAWRVRNGLSEHQFEDFVADQALGRWVQLAFRDEIVRRAADCLRVSGDYPRLLSRARAKQRALEEAGLADVGLERVGLSRSELIDRYARERLGLPAQLGPDRLAREAGFASGDALERALVREHLYEQCARNGGAAAAGANANSHMRVKGQAEFDELIGRLAASPAVERWGKVAYDRHVGQLSQTPVAHVDALAAAAGITAESSILELGCGSGGFACHLASRTGCRVLGLDWSQTALALARERAKVAGFAERVRFSLRDLRDYDWPRGTFDVVVAIDALQFAPDLPALVTRVAQTLVPDGRLAALVTIGSAEQHAPVIERAELTAAYAAAGLLPPETTLLTVSYAALVERMADCWSADLGNLRQELGSELADARLHEDATLARLLEQKRVARVLDVVRRP
jgi:SAM-dependent methyltransferase